MNRSSRWLGLLLAASVVAGGCSERKLVITSEPSRALVTVNQTWSGYTPFTLPFKHHGTYDIRLEKEGYYPLFVAEPVAAPLHQQPGIDFVTEVLPVTARDIRKLHYKLEPISDPDDIEAIFARRDEAKARATRAAELRKARDANRKTVPLPLPTKDQPDEDELPAGEATEEGSAPTDDDAVTPEPIVIEVDGPEIE